MKRFRRVYSVIGTENVIHINLKIKIAALRCTPQVKPTFGFFIMTKISKQTKLRAIHEYLESNLGLNKVARKYGISGPSFQMLLSAFHTHGPDILFTPPKIDTNFRIKVARWAIVNNASYTEVAAQFGYVRVQQIYNWGKIYSQQGPNGLMSIEKGRPPKKPKKTTKSIKPLTDTDNRLAQLEAENLRLRIQNEALKLLASMEQ